MLEIIGLLADSSNLTSDYLRSSEGLSAILCLPSKGLKSKVWRSVKGTVKGGRMRSGRSKEGSNRFSEAPLYSPDHKVSKNLTAMVQNGQLENQVI